MRRRPGWLGERGAGRWAEAGDDVDHAIGDADFFREAAEVDGGERRVFGWFDDDRVTGGEGGGDAPTDQEEREVPGEDVTAGAPGLAHRPGFVAFDGEHVAAADVLGHFGEVADRGDEVGDVALGVRLELAGVEGFDLADDRDAAFDFVGEAVEQGAAFVRGHGGPAGGVEGFLGGGDGGVDVLGGEAGDGGEFFAGAGIVGFERRLVGAGCCFAADEGLLQFAVEEFAYFGNQIKCRRSHVSPRRMDADGPTFRWLACLRRPTQNLSQLAAESKAGGRNWLECLTQSARRRFESIYHEGHEGHEEG